MNAAKWYLVSGFYRQFEKSFFSGANGHKC